MIKLSAGITRLTLGAFKGTFLYYVFLGRAGAVPCLTHLQTTQNHPPTTQSEGIRLMPIWSIP